MARGKSSPRNRRVTTYRVTSRSAQPRSDRNRRLAIVGGLAVVGVIVVALGLSGALQGLLGPGGTPGPSRPPALAAGTYQSQAFRPQLTFTVPVGWWVAADAADFFELAPVDADQVGIYLFRNPKAASQAPDCPLAPDASVGTLSTDLSTWIRGRPGFLVSNPRLAEVGGLRGVELDVGIVATWTTSCPFANGAPTVPMFVDQAAGLRWVVAGSERLRLSLLDVPGGGTVVVDVDAFDGSLMTDFLGRATPIVGTFRFAPTSASPAPSAGSP